MSKVDIQNEMTTSFQDVEKNKEIVNSFTLKFNNNKLEREYDENNKNSRRRLNFKLFIFNLIISVGLLVLIKILKIISHKEFKTKGVKLENFNELKYKGFNRTDLIFYDRFLLLNETKLKEVSNRTTSNDNEYMFLKDYTEESIVYSNEFYISNNILEYYYLIFSNTFINKAFIVSVILTLFYLVMLTLMRFVKNDLFQKFSFCANFFVSEYNFHLISGILLVYLNLSIEFLFFVITIHLFIQILLTSKVQISWIFIGFSSIHSVLLEWSIFYMIHNKIYKSMIFYISVNNLANLSCIVLAYYTEFNFKKEFYLIRKLNTEKNYLMNILSNMSQGFLSYNRNKKVMSFNKTMNRIVNEYNSSNYDYGNDENGVIITDTEEAYTLMLGDTHKKVLIENILLNIVELEYEIAEIFQNNKLKLEDLFQAIKYNNKFSDFSYLGLVNINSKKYQLNFRIISHEYDELFLEIMFTDISQIVKNEREKAYTKSRSIYLSKIAHEFKNPLTSLIELSSSIKEELKNNELSKPNIHEINNNLDYSKCIYKKMTNFLKDFQIFANLKFHCKNYCQDFIACNNCQNKSLCKKCNTCNFCEQKKITVVDFASLIDQNILNFKTMSDFENKKFQINYLNCDNVYTNSQNQDNIKNEFTLNKIFTNYDLLSSSINNLINYAYKSSNSHFVKEILIKTQTVRNNNNTCITSFEIIEEGLEIDYNYLDKITNFGDCNNDYSDEMNSDKFNKYFNLYASFFMIKKLGSEIKIENVNNFNKFSFSIENKADSKLLEQFSVNKLHGLNEHKLVSKSNPDWHKNLNIDNLHKTILIIDDEHLIRNILKRYLTKINEKFIVEEAANCFEAINIIYNKYLENTYFDIIIIDEYMPNMKGSSLIKLLRQLHHENNFYNMKIISHTAFDNEEKKRFILDSGADYILNKPLKFADFQEFMKEVA